MHRCVIMGPRFVMIPSSTTADASEDSLLKLEQVLVKALPTSVQLLVLCRIAIQRKFPEDADVKFYRYTEVDSGNEDKWWGEVDRSPFIVCVEKPNIHTKKGLILLPPLSPSPEMIEAFDEFVGWTEPQVFQCVQPPLWDHLEILCTKHRNLNPKNSAGIPGIMLAILDVDRAKRANVGDNEKDPDYVLKALEDKNVAEMVQQWKWAAPHSEEVIRKCIKTLVSCGLFPEVGEGEEEMGSYAMLSPIGSINMLYTPEKHRRKGYGKIVMEWIAKEAAIQLGIPPMAEVEVWNEASKKLLEKAGFEEVFKTNWYYYDPPPSP